MRAVRRGFGIVLGLILWGLGGVAQAQQQKVWVQIDAEPTLSAAMDTARAYGARFDQVQGYQLGSGGYAIVLGPMESGVAVTTLQGLLAQNMIAAGSALSSGQAFGQQFWPVGAADQTAVAQNLPLAQDDALGLDEEGRRAVQTALKWFGYYAGLIDGNIGSGSRAAIAAWQTAQGYDPTGVLSADQSASLIDTFRAEDRAFGLETITDPIAGIEISLPMAMLTLDSTTPPFVRYAAKNGSGVTALLISQPGGTQATLSDLYDLLQKLDIMPVVGDRTLESSYFTLTGRSAKIQTHAYAEIVGGAVKGYVLSWDATKGDQMPRMVAMMQSSFRSTGDVVLDPASLPLDEAAKRGLLAGMSVKNPKATRSGFFIDQAGSVLTTIEAVENCGTITLDQNHGAKVSFADKASGVAVLTPEAAIAPRSVAVFAPDMPHVGSPIAVSGYSYGARLSAPILTQGTLEETQGLNGEQGLLRLALQAMPGDAGGPVLDKAGVVVGLLLPAQIKAGKDLPDGVAYAISATALAKVLTHPQGPSVQMAQSTAVEAPTANALHRALRDMTVLVSCWD